MSEKTTISSKQVALDQVQEESKKVLAYLLQKYPQSISRSSAGNFASKV